MSDPLRATATEIVRRLQTAGFVACWVGGCVRDYLLGRKPEDYDIATDARPEQIEKLFSRTIAVGRKFGVMLVVEQRKQFQVATFRAESDYQDGRHPESVVLGVSLEQDLARRDSRYSRAGLRGTAACRSSSRSASSRANRSRPHRALHAEDG